MKRCPECRRDYYDDSLLYCLDDGSALLEGPSVDEPATALWIPVGEEANTAILSGTSSAFRAPSKQTRPKHTDPRTTLIVAGAMIAVAVGGLALYRDAFRHGPVTERFKNVTLTRVTAEGAVESATISPDGKYIAYSLEESGKRSLWTKHLASESRVQIVEPVEAISMYAGAFSPDGGYIYYTRQDGQFPKGALYAVPVLGGASRKIADDVSQPVSVSRDGKQIVFGRYKLSGTDDQLLIVDTNGSNERLLATVREPDFLQGSSAAWSPDGTEIAIGFGSQLLEAGGPSPVYKMKVAVVAIDEPSFRTVGTRSWSNIGNMVWFSDGGGLAFIAGERRSGAKQIWHCSYPSGEISRITNDLNSYDFESLSVTADDSSLIAVQKHPVSQIWVAPGGDTAKAYPVATRRNVQDGRNGIAWTPDGRLVYDSSADSNSSIWSINVDGTDPRQLTDGNTDDFAPEVAPDGRHIIFGAVRNGYQLWQMDIDGNNARQITYGTGTPTFSYSPDGRWIVFNPYLGGIYKMDAAGGEPTELVYGGALVSPQVSPNGELLAYLMYDKDNRRPKINIIKFDGGAAVKQFELPVSSMTNFFESLSYRGFHWLPDGEGIVYIDTVGGVSNLWTLNLDGGPAKKVTDFKSDRIYSFAYAPDGRTIAFSRGNDTPDAVLIKNVE